MRALRRAVKMAKNQVFCFLDIVYKYQTDVVKFSLAKMWCAPEHCMTQRLSFGCCQYIQSIVVWVFQCGYYECLFVSEPDDGNITGRVLFASCFELLSIALWFALVGSCLANDGDFRSQCSVATRFRCGRMFDWWRYYRFTAEFDSERICKKKRSAFGEVRRQSMAAWALAYMHVGLHRVSKNVPTLACYNFDAHECLLIFFWRKCYR